LVSNVNQQDQCHSHAIDSGKVNPFHSQTLGQVHHGSLAGIISGLLLRHVNQQRTDRRCEDQASGALFLEDPSSALSRVHGTVEVDIHDLTPLRIRVLLCWVVRSDATVSDHDIKFAEVLGDLLESRLDLRGVPYV
jgi:hypothetical protein